MHIYGIQKNGTDELICRTGIHTQPQGTNLWTQRGKEKVEHTESSADIYTLLPLSSVQFSPSVMSDSLQPCGLQHARPPCPSPTVHTTTCRTGKQWEAAIYNIGSPGQPRGVGLVGMPRWRGYRHTYGRFTLLLQQKPTQHCRTIILQLQINKQNKIFLKKNIFDEVINMMNFIKSRPLSTRL